MAGYIEVEPGNRRLVMASFNSQPESTKNPWEESLNEGLSTSVSNGNDHGGLSWLS